MQPFEKAIITFVLVYLTSLVTRSIVAKEREQKPFSAGMKERSNHTTAAVIALVVAVGTGFYI